MQRLFRLISGFLFTAFLIPGLVWSQTASTPQAQRLLESVKYLASEECQGRSPGTPGIERAADYIATQFTTMGLVPAGKATSFNNSFTMVTRAELGKNNSVVFSVKRERPGVPIEKVPALSIQWQLGQDYQPYSFTRSTSVTGKVVFVGYGISTPGQGYDDYKGVDVKGAVVIALRGLPAWAEKNHGFYTLASIRSKVTTARDKGAAAIILVNSRGDSADVLSKFGTDSFGKESGIVALQVRRTQCAGIFPHSVPTLFNSEQTIDKKRKPQSYLLPNTTVTITTDVEFKESTTRNIVGMVRGTDPSLSGEYIVIGAHYDHLGFGDEGSLAASKEPAIHHGADDNASGTAGMLELARRFSESPAKRSVVFMAFSGEEKGLLGSKHWVQSPTLPLKSLVTMINMDMIGHLTNNKLNIHGTGTSTTWPELIERTNKDFNFTISTTTDGFSPSDHSSFTPLKVPVLFFFTGLHSDYHRPTDTWEKLNYDGEARILDFIETVVRSVADTTERPLFTEGAEKPSANHTSTGFKVVFGVIPDYSDNPAGLLISGVRDGAPAAKAGLQANDIITQFGSTAVKNIYDLTAAMGDKNPGDVVKVTVIRNDTSMEFSVTLAAPAR